MNRAVFLDRDNTIIRNDGDLGDPAQVRLMQGAATAIASMRGLGYRIVVVTNQGGVARGRFTEDDVTGVHDRIAELLQEQSNGAVVDRFYFCPFHPEATVKRYQRDHSWRKPQPGMLLQAAADLKLDLTASWLVGDQLRDVEAGRAAGVRTILLAREWPSVERDEQQPHFLAGSLVESARVIAQHIKPQTPATEPATPRPTRSAAGEGRESSAEPQPEPSSGGARPSGEQAGEAEAPAGPTRSTYPAVAPLQTTHRSGAPRRQTSRPFKPWTIQPVDVRDAAYDEPRRSIDRATKPESETEPPPAAEATEVERDVEVEIERGIEPPAAAEASTPTARPPRRPTSATRPASTAGAAETESAPAAKTEPLTREAEAEPADESAGAGASRIGGGQQIERLLGQILRELRGRTLEHADYSLFKVLALGVAQPVALACVVLGILTAFDSPMTLTNWLLGGAIGQLAVVTLLLLHWQR